MSREHIFALLASLVPLATIPIPMVISGRGNNMYGLVDTVDAYTPKYLQPTKFDDDVIGENANSLQYGIGPRWLREGAPAWVGSLPSVGADEILQAIHHSVDNIAPSSLAVWGLGLAAFTLLVFWEIRIHPAPVYSHETTDTSTRAVGHYRDVISAEQDTSLAFLISPDAAGETSPDPNYKYTAAFRPASLPAPSRLPSPCTSTSHTVLNEYKAQAEGQFENLPLDPNITAEALTLPISGAPPNTIKTSTTSADTSTRGLDFEVQQELPSCSVLESPTSSSVVASHAIVHQHTGQLQEVGNEEPQEHSSFSEHAIPASGYVRDCTDAVLKGIENDGHHHLPVRDVKLPPTPTNEFGQALSPALTDPKSASIALSPPVSRSPPISSRSPSPSEPVNTDQEPTHPLHSGHKGTHTADIDVSSLCVSEIECTSTAADACVSAPMLKPENKNKHKIEAPSIAAEYPTPSLPDSPNTSAVVGNWDSSTAEYRQGEEIASLAEDPLRLPASFSISAFNEPEENETATNVSPISVDAEVSVRTGDLLAPITDTGGKAAQEDIMRLPTLSFVVAHALRDDREAAMATMGGLIERESRIRTLSDITEITEPEPVSVCVSPVIGAPCNPAAPIIGVDSDAYGRDLPVQGSPGAIVSTATTLPLPASSSSDKPAPLAGHVESGSGLSEECDHTSSAIPDAPKRTPSPAAPTCSAPLGRASREPSELNGPNVVPVDVVENKTLTLDDLRIRVESRWGERIMGTCSTDSDNNYTPTMNTPTPTTIAHASGALARQSSVSSAPQAARVPARNRSLSVSCALSPMRVSGAPIALSVKGEECPHQLDAAPVSAVPLPCIAPSSGTRGDALDRQGPAPPNTDKPITRKRAPSCSALASTPVSKKAKLPAPSAPAFPSASTRSPRPGIRGSGIPRAVGGPGRGTGWRSGNWWNALVPSSESSSASEADSESSSGDEASASEAEATIPKVTRAHGQALQQDPPVPESGDSPEEEIQMPDLVPANLAETDMTRALTMPSLVASVSISGNDLGRRPVVSADMDMDVDMAVDTPPQNGSLLSPASRTKLKEIARRARCTVMAPLVYAGPAPLESASGASGSVSVSAVVNPDRSGSEYPASVCDSGKASDLGSEMTANLGTTAGLGLGSLAESTSGCDSASGSGSASSSHGFSSDTTQSRDPAEGMLLLPSPALSDYELHFMSRAMDERAKLVVSSRVEEQTGQDAGVIVRLKTSTKELAAADKDEEYTTDVPRFRRHSMVPLPLPPPPTAGAQEPRGRSVSAAAPAGHAGPRDQGNGNDAGVGNTPSVPRWVPRKWGAGTFGGPATPPPTPRPWTYEQRSSTPALAHFPYRRATTSFVGARVQGRDTDLSPSSRSTWWRSGGPK